MELETNLQDVFGINKPPAYVAYVEEQDFASFLSGGSGSVKVLFDHTASGSGFQKIEFQKARLLSSNLKLISSTFNLTDEDFSQICGVTRKTIHNWKNNLSAIQSKNSSKIFNLIIAAKNWKVNGFKVSRNELRTEIISGKSIFDILKGTPLNQNLLNMAGQRLALSTQPKKLENPFS